MKMVHIAQCACIKCGHIVFASAFTNEFVSDEAATTALKAYIGFHVELGAIDAKCPLCRHALRCESRITKWATIREAMPEIERVNMARQVAIDIHRSRN